MQAEGCTNGTSSSFDRPMNEKAFDDKAQDDRFPWVSLVIFVIFFVSFVGNRKLLHVTSVLSAHLIQRMRDLSQRTIFYCFHQLFKNIPITDRCIL